MTLLHIDLHRAHPLTHDEQDAEGWCLGLELFGLVFEFWLGIRK